MINKDKLKEYIKAFRRPEISPSIQFMEEIKAELERVSYELMKTQVIMIDIAKALGVETRE
jgi:hypothetical protein